MKLVLTQLRGLVVDYFLTCRPLQVAGWTTTKLWDEKVQSGTANPAETDSNSGLSSSHQVKPGQPEGHKQKAPFGDVIHLAAISACDLQTNSSQTAILDLMCVILPI